MRQYLDSLTESAKKRLFFFIVIVITFSCFMPTLFNDLLMNWDDGYGIINNEHIRQLSFETFRWAFTEFYFRDWLPLVWISFAIEYALWGLNPIGYHLTNNIMHSFNAGLFYFISLELVRQYKIQNSTSTLLAGNRVYCCAALAALLFALHPLRVESVAWAFERKDVLSLLFGLLSLLAYIRFVKSKECSASAQADTLSFLSDSKYWLAILFYMLSLFSKSMLVSLPLVLLILDWFPFNRFSRKKLKIVLLEKVFFILLAGTTSAILMTVHAAGKMPLSESGMLSRLLIAFKSIMGYLLLMLWPVNLSHFHLHPGNIQKIGSEYLIPIFVFLVISLCCFLLIRRWPVVMAVWSIYVITLIPVLGFTQVSSTAMADRYTYVPGLAVSLLAALGIFALAGKFPASHLGAKTVAVGTLVILALFCYLTVRQIAYWKDDVSLWSRAIELQPNFSGRMYAERAAAYKEKGEFDKALLDMNEAIAIATMKHRPKMEDLYFERAQIHLRLGESERAAADYNYGLSLMSGQK